MASAKRAQDRDRLGDRELQAVVTDSGNMGAAYYALSQYTQAIEYDQQALAIKREIGDRYGEAISLFNLGKALARVDEKWEAHQTFESAKVLFQDLGMLQHVEDSEQAIYNWPQKLS